MTPALEEFGKAVRRARTAKGWTLETLAELALSNPERKSYVSKIERGQQALSALTIGRIATALELPQDVTDPVMFAAAAEDSPPSAEEMGADRLFEETQDLPETLKVSEELAIALAIRFAGANPTDLGAALRELERALEIATRTHLPGNTDAAVEAVLAEVDRLNAEGRIAEAGERLRAELSAAEEREAREGASVDRLLIRAEEQAVLERDPQGAASAIARRLARDLPDPAARFAALRKVQDEWYERGRDKGLGFDLEVAIALARATRDMARNADDRGAALNDLGNALATFGERETGTERLEQAVAAYRAALEVCTQDRVPLHWARTQNNLGNALAALGQRETGTIRLEQAIAAYRLALEVYAQDRVPLDWAGTQNNLGAALQTLGERETGTDRLEQAVVAYRAALEERTRDRVPLDWAMTQNNLGNALRILGARETGTDRLEQAIASFRAALEERTRDRVPLDWATTQMNLGTALQTLGERETGTDRLEQAVAAYRAALEVYTQDRVPLDWAMTQNNLGNALQTLGVRETGTDRLEQAVAAYRAALEERTRDRVPLDWAMTQNNLGSALATLGERETGTERLEQAVAAYRAALQERTRDRVPFNWAVTQHCLAGLGITWFDKTGDAKHLDNAETHALAAREVYVAGGASHYVAWIDDDQLAAIARRRQG